MHIVVLNDGSTYSDIKGCQIVWVHDTDNPEKVEEWLKDLPKAEARGYAERVTELK